MAAAAQKQENVREHVKLFYACGFSEFAHQLNERLRDADRVNLDLLLPERSAEFHPLVDNYVVTSNINDLAYALAYIRLFCGCDVDEFLKLNENSSISSRVCNTLLKALDTQPICACCLIRLITDASPVLHYSIAGVVATWIDKKERQVSTIDYFILGRLLHLLQSTHNLNTQRKTLLFQTDPKEAALMIWSSNLLSTEKQILTTDLVRMLIDRNQFSFENAKNLESLISARFWLNSAKLSAIGDISTPLTKDIEAELLLLACFEAESYQELFDLIKSIEGHNRSRFSGNLFPLLEKFSRFARVLRNLPQSDEKFELVLGDRVDFGLVASHELLIFEHFVDLAFIELNDAIRCIRSFTISATKSVHFSSFSIDLLYNVMTFMAFYALRLASTGIWSYVEGLSSLQPASGDADAVAAYQEQILSYFDECANVTSNIFPLRLRLELIQNLFSLMFATFSQVHDRFQSLSDDEEDGEATRRSPSPSTPNATPSSFWSQSTTFDRRSAATQNFIAGDCVFSAGLLRDYLTILKHVVDKFEYCCIQLMSADNISYEVGDDLLIMNEEVNSQLTNLFYPTTPAADLDLIAEAKTLRNEISHALWRIPILFGVSEQFGTFDHPRMGSRQTSGSSCGGKKPTRKFGGELLIERLFMSPIDMYLRTLKRGQEKERVQVYSLFEQQLAATQQCIELSSIERLNRHFTALKQTTLKRENSSSSKLRRLTEKASNNSNYRQQLNALFDGEDFANFTDSHGGCGDLDLRMMTMLDAKMVHGVGNLADVNEIDRIVAGVKAPNGRGPVDLERLKHIIVNQSDHPNMLMSPLMQLQSDTLLSLRGFVKQLSEVKAKIGGDEFLDALISLSRSVPSNANGCQIAFMTEFASYLSKMFHNYKSTGSQHADIRLPQHLLNFSPEQVFASILLQKRQTLPVLQNIAMQINVKLLDAIIFSCTPKVPHEIVSNSDCFSDSIAVLVHEISQLVPTFPHKVDESHLKCRLSRLNVHEPAGDLTLNAADYLYSKMPKIFFLCIVLQKSDTVKSILQELSSSNRQDSPLFLDMAQPKYTLVKKLYPFYVYLINCIRPLFDSTRFTELRESNDVNETLLGFSPKEKARFLLSTNSSDYANLCAKEILHCVSCGRLDEAIRIASVLHDSEPIIRLKDLLYVLKCLKTCEFDDPKQLDEYVFALEGIRSSALKSFLLNVHSSMLDISHLKSLLNTLNVADSSCEMQRKITVAFEISRVLQGEFTNTDGLIAISSKSEFRKQIIDVLAACDKFSILFDWFKFFAPADCDQKSKVIRAVLMRSILKQSPDDLVDSFKLLNGEFGRESVADVCNGIVADLAADRDFESLQLVGAAFDLPDEVKEGICIYRTLPKSNKQSYLHLISKPIVLLEQMLMNMEIEAAERLVHLLMSRVDESSGSDGESFLTVLHNLLSVYCSKAVEFPPTKEAVACMMALNDKKTGGKRVRRDSTRQDLGKLIIQHDHLSSASSPTPSIDAIGMGGLSKNLWMKDGDANECVLCDKPFNVFTRRHHCRRCGKVICSDCSSNRFVLVTGEEAVRVCLSCFGTLNALRSGGGSATPSDEAKAGDTQPRFWLLKDDESDSELRGHFYYESAPNVSLCISLLNIHQHSGNLALKLVDYIAKFFKMEPLLVTGVIKQLIGRARDAFNKDGDLSGLEMCETFSSRVDWIEKCQNSNCDISFISLHRMKEGFATLLEELIQLEEYVLAIELCTLMHQDRSLVWKCWGFALLKNYQFGEAREKFTHILRRLADKNNMREKNAHLHDILNLLKRLRYDFEGEKEMPIEAEMDYYVDAYGSYFDILSAYHKTSRWQRSAQFILDNINSISIEMIYQGFILSCFRDGQFLSLSDAVQSTDRTLERWREILCRSYACLERDGLINCLYKIQILNYDFIRAARSLIRIFKEAKCKTYKEQTKMLVLLGKAKSYLETYSNGETWLRVAQPVASVSTNLTEREYLSASGVKDFTVLIRTQSEITQFLSRVFSPDDRVLHIFDEANIAPILKQIYSTSKMEEVFAYLRNVIDYTHANQLDSWSAVVVDLCAKNRFDDVVFISQQIDAGLADQLFLAAVESRFTIPNIEMLIKNIRSDALRVRALVVAGKLRSAYLQAVKLNSIEQVRFVCDSAMRLRDANVEKLCCNWLLKNEGKFNFYLSGDSGSSYSPT